MTIQEIIEEKIRRAGLTKKEVSDRASFNSGNMNKMLASPSWPTLERIANALGLTVAQLVTPPEEEKSQEMIVKRVEVPQSVTCPHCGAGIVLEIKAAPVF